MSGWKGIEDVLKATSPAYQVITDLKKGGGGGAAVAKDLTGDAVDMAKMAAMGGFKKGGKVKKTGLYKLHQGERVLNKKQTKQWPGNKH